MQELHADFLTGDKEPLRHSIWEDLNGQTLVFAGMQNALRSCLVQNLADLGSQKGDVFEVKDGMEYAKKGSCFLFFARPDVSDWTDASAAWDGTLALLDELQSLEEWEPKEVLLLSSAEVYGKIFGQPHLIRENETGYLCNTRLEDMAAQCMRTIECFAHDLAKEKEIPIKIARVAGTDLQETNGSALRQEKEQPVKEQDLKLWMDAVLSVLLYGQTGEIFNIPELNPKVVQADAQQSPLRPIENHTDVTRVMEQ